MSSEGLSQLPLKELKEYIQAYQLPSKNAIEKDDLVRIIFNTRPLSNENELSYRNQRHKLNSNRKNNSSFSFSNIVQDIFTSTTQPSPRSSPRQRPREQRAESPPEQRRPQYRPQPEQRSQTAPRQPEQRQQASERKEPIPRPELTLHDLVQTNTDASSLSVRTLKSILKANFVEQSHVIEKSELVKLVNRLADQQRKTTSQPRDDVLCRICLDAEQNCVFLNCGHMAACMDCAKTVRGIEIKSMFIDGYVQLIETKNECPICREPILKLVHVFRS